MGCLAKGLGIIVTIMQGAFLAIFSLVVSVGSFWWRKVSTAFRENRPQHGAVWLVGEVGLLFTLCVCPSLVSTPTPNDTVTRPTAVTTTDDAIALDATALPMAALTPDALAERATATTSRVSPTSKSLATPTTAVASDLPPTWTPVDGNAVGELPPTWTPVGGNPVAELSPTWTPIASATPAPLPPTWTPIPPSLIVDPATPTEIPALPTAEPPTPVPPIEPPSGGGSEGGTGNPSGFECSEDGCQQPPDPNCPIKGNISMSSGDRIYHIPGWPNYDTTLIDTTAGERWFCTEDEAVAAGWRKPKNV